MIYIPRERSFNNWGRHPKANQGLVGNCCRIPPLRYRQIQLLEAGEPTLFIGGMGSRVVTTSFAPESRRRWAAWVMFGRAPEADGIFQIRKLRA